MRGRVLLLLFTLVAASVAGCVKQSPDAGDEGGPMVVISGSVNDSATGEAVPGAEVVLSHPDGDQKQSSDGDGRFSFTVAPAGQCDLSAAAPGYFGTSGTFACDRSFQITAALDPFPAGTTFTATPSPFPSNGSVDEGPFILYGTVFDRSSQDPIVGALVTADSPAGAQVVRTDLRGIYGFTLDPGPVKLRVEDGCHDPLAKDLDLQATERLDFYLDTPQTPAPPTDLASVPGPGPGMVTIHWDAPEEGPAPTGYDVYRGGALYARLGNSLSFGDHSPDGSAYQVASVSACGARSDLSTPVDAADPDGTPSLATAVGTTPYPDAVVSEATYPVTNGTGKVIDNATWRIVEETGNCCENYVAASPDGRIFDFGGTFLHYSDDEGKTWSEVETGLNLYTGGEGAVMAGPGGDVLAVGWSPYGGDRPWAHKYVAAEDQWYHAPMPVHTPLWDREWIEVIKGPFFIDDQVIPYITFAIGGTGSKETILYSLDGLHYLDYTIPVLDVTLNSIDLGTIDLDPDPDRDWIQGSQAGLIAPLGPGFGFRDIGCGEVLYGSLAWQCPTFSETTVPDGRLVADAAGDLHSLAMDDKAFTYRVSHDGGRHWVPLAVNIPSGFTSGEWDWRVQSSSDQAVVVVHAERTSGTAQDLAFRIINVTTSPVLKEVLQVGGGDGTADSGIATQGPRFDFTTVAFLPDGRMVLSFTDSDHSPPALAIEMPRTPDAGS